jgi:transcriptional regulator with XRE-family HTH domain
MHKSKGVSVSIDAQRGARLKEERDRMGWSQQQVADALEIRREMWAKYEAGAEPGATVLARAALVGVDVLYVLTGQREFMPPSAGAVLRDGEATLLAGYRSLDARGRAGVMALISGMAPGGVSVHVSGGTVMGHVAGAVHGAPPAKRARKAATKATP